MRTLRAPVLVVIAVLAAARSLIAHHEWPVDHSTRVRIQGTVVAITWANPHVMIALDVDAHGTIEHWTGGGSSPQFMTTCGWKKTTVKPGDVVTVLAYRYKDGSTAAQMQSMVLPSGKEMFYGAPPMHADLCGTSGRDTPIGD